MSYQLTLCKIDSYSPVPLSLEFKLVCEVLSELSTLVALPSFPNDKFVSGTVQKNSP